MHKHIKLHFNYVGNLPHNKAESSTPAAMPTFKYAKMAWK